MNITDRRKENNFVDFKDIDYGMPFEFQVSEFQVSFFLKTNNDSIENNDFTNDVNLKTGMCCKFDDEDKVRLVNASIVINNFEEE